MHLRRARVSGRAAHYRSLYHHMINAVYPRGDGVDLTGDILKHISCETVVALFPRLRNFTASAIHSSLMRSPCHTHSFHPTTVVDYSRQRFRVLI